MTDVILNYESKYLIETFEAVYVTKMLTLGLHTKGFRGM